MSKSRLGDSIMNVIDGGNSKQNMEDGDDKDPFHRAQVAEEEHGIEKGSRLEPGLHNDPIIPESLENTVDKQAHRPEKIKKTERKKGSKITGYTAVAVSVLAATIAGYSLVSVIQWQAIIVENTANSDTAIGSLTTRVDELTVNLLHNSENTQSNIDRLNKIERIKGDIGEAKKTLNLVKSEVEGLKNQLSGQDKIIEKHQTKITEFEEQLKKIKTSTPKTVKKISRNVRAVATKTDTNRIEGSSIASIDSWGTQMYVMLMGQEGEWIPLSKGDYYKGWRLESVSNSEAVFRQGSKRKRMKVEE